MKVQKSRTKDETYLMKLYEVVEGDCTKEVNAIKLGDMIKYSYRLVDTLVNGLARINCVKKGDNGTIRLTENGTRLVLALIEENNPSK